MPRRRNSPRKFDAEIGATDSDEEPAASLWNGNNISQDNVGQDSIDSNSFVSATAAAFTLPVKIDYVDNQSAPEAPAVAPPIGDAVKHVVNFSTDFSLPASFTRKARRGKKRMLNASADSQEDDNVTLVKFKRGKRQKIFRKAACIWETIRISTGGSNDDEQDDQSLSVASPETGLSAIRVLSPKQEDDDDHDDDEWIDVKEKAKRGTRRERVKDEIRFDQFGHFPDLKEKSGRCFMCDRRENKKSRFYCVKCNAYLCLTHKRNCFTLWHTQF